MKKHIFGRQFKRDINERKALFRGLVSELVMHERIVTTEEKAKAIRSSTDKLVTKAKKQDTMHATSLLQPYLSSEAVKKMMHVIGPRFKDRQGGYTRIIRLGKRFNDNAQTVRMEWVSLSDQLGGSSADASTKKTEKTALPATIATKKPATEKKTKESKEPKAKTTKKAVKKAKKEDK